jgi:hypothetical protein
MSRAELLRVANDHRFEQQRPPSKICRLVRSYGYLTYLRWAPRLDRLRNDRSRLRDGQDPRDCRKCLRACTSGSSSGADLVDIQVIITNGNLEVVDDGLEFVIHAEKPVLDKFD